MRGLNTPKHIKDLIIDEFFNNKLSRKEISFKHNIHYATVAKFIRDNPKQDVYRQEIEQRNAEIKRLHFEDKLTYKQIGLIYNFSSVTIHKIVRDKQNIRLLK